MAGGKFVVYENAAITSALSRRNPRPKPWHFSIILCWFFGSLWALWITFFRSAGIVDFLTETTISQSAISQSVARTAVQTGQFTVIINLLMSVSALFKVVSLQITPDTSITVGSKLVGNKESATTSFSDHKQALTSLQGSNKRSWAQSGGLHDSPLDYLGVTLRQKPSRTRLSPSHSSSPVLLVPIHSQVSKTKPISSPWNGLVGSASSAGQVNSSASLNKTTSSESPYLVTPFPAPPHSGASTNQKSSIASPWSREKVTLGKDEINNEEKLAKFLAEVEEGFNKPAVFMTPPPTVPGVASGPSPSTMQSAVSLSSVPHSGPIRALRMSPITPKTGSPKKGDLEIPLPMSMEQATEGFKRLGICSHIEQWRDRLRQWFSEMLLHPLVSKLDTSHAQAMAAAAELGISISVLQIGATRQDGGSVMPSLAEAPLQEWLTTIVPDEDTSLHQLRATLLQARDGPLPVQNTLFGLAPPQERLYIPSLQACIDAVTEHQRLKALVKGEWVKGLIPQSTVRADYTVQRIRELETGTCVKGYEYWPDGEVYDKVAKRWTGDLPSDAHLLLYLFCALLEHPLWMLHVDPTSYPSTQSGNNSLFVASLPNKERYPDKYIAIISGAPPVLHAGATVLAVGKSTPPVFALYWDKKLQFSLQGRTALWDAILLLCYRIKVGHGGVVRGINLGSSAFYLLSVLEPSIESSPIR